METHDRSFRDLMKSYHREKAPDGFTGKVMSKIEPKAVSVYKPVFGKWFISVIAVIFGTFLIYACFSTGTQGAIAYPDLLPDIFLMKIENAVTEAIRIFEHAPKELIFVAFAAILLLLIDLFFQQIHRTEAK